MQCWVGKGGTDWESIVKLNCPKDKQHCATAICKMRNMFFIFMAILFGPKFVVPVYSYKLYY